MNYWILLFILLSAGCIGNGGKFQTNGGVIITHMSVLPQEVYKYEQFNVEVELKNVGNYEVKNGVLYIYGPSWMKTQNNEMFQESFSLMPADPINGIPGESRIISASFEAVPELNLGASQSYDIYARACYPYQTRYSVTITYSSRNERITTKETVGKGLEGKIYAPIGIKLTSLSKYVKHQTGEIVFILTVENRGDGFPASVNGCSAVPKFEESNKLKEIVVESDRGKVICKRGEEGKEHTLENVYLSDGKASLRCTLSGLPTDVPEIQITLNVIASYYYYVTESAKLTVMVG